MDGTDYKSAMFETYQGETACWILLGPNDIYNSCKVTVTAAKSTVNGLVKVALGSVNVKVTNP